MAFLAAQLVLPVRDLRRAVSWYPETLGFEVVCVPGDPLEDPEGNDAILRRDRAVVHVLREELPRSHDWSRWGTGYLYLVVEDIEPLCRELESRDVVIHRELQREDWRVKAFPLLHPSGNLILIAEPVEGVTAD